MAINSEDGEFALDCWVDPDGDSEPVTEYSDDDNELRARAQEYLRAGKYKYMVLSQWDEDANDWDELGDFGAEEAA